MNDKKIEDGGPAFPFKCQGPTTAPETYYGMSLRDWFAGQALAMAGAATLANIRDSGIIPGELTQMCATQAYAIADAMIAARGGAR